VITARLIGMLVNAGVAMFGQSPPTVAAGIPNPPSGIGATTFTVSATDTGGAASIASVQMLIDWSLNGTNACYVMYEPSGGLYLAGDQGGWLGPNAPGTGAPLTNGQCSLDTAQTTVSCAGNTVTVHPVVTFNPTFVGTMGVYLYASDTAGNNTGWQQASTYITSPADSRLPTGSVTPSSGAGLSQVFTVSAQDWNGWKYIGTTLLLIGPTNATAANSCLVMLTSGYGGAVYLMNDAYTIWQGPKPLGTFRWLWRG
jgi:hypothetical protein